MLILSHLKLIQELTGVPLKRIKAVKFGFDINWSVSTPYTLGGFAIPNNQSLIVLRVECSTINYSPGAPDFGVMQSHPSGKAYWIAGTGLSSGKPVTNKDAPAHLVLDSDELLAFNENQTVTLIGHFNASPDAYARSVRTVVYGYLVPSDVIDVLALPEMFHAVIQ